MCGHLGERGEHGCNPAEQFTSRFHSRHISDAAGGGKIDQRCRLDGGLEGGFVECRLILTAKATIALGDVENNQVVDLSSFVRRSALQEAKDQNVSSQVTT